MMSKNMRKNLKLVVESPCLSLMAKSLDVDSLGKANFTRQDLSSSISQQGILVTQITNPRRYTVKGVRTYTMCSMPFSFLRVHRLDSADTRREIRARLCV